MTFRRIPADPLTGWRHWLRHGHPPHLQDPRGIPRQNHEHLLRCALPQGTVIPPCVLLQCRNTATLCPVSYYNPTTLCPVSYYKAGISQYSHFVSCVLFQGRNIPVQSLCVLCLITRQQYPNTVTLCPVAYYKVGMSQYSHFVSCVLLQGRNVPIRSRCTLSQGVGISSYALLQIRNTPCSFSVGVMAVWCTQNLRRDGCSFMWHHAAMPVL